MSDRKISKLPFNSDRETENDLWQALVELPEETPSAKLRPAFYRQLERENRESFMQKLNRWLGISNNIGWATAVAFGVLGVGVANFMHSSGLNSPDYLPATTQDTRLTALEQSVTSLNRQLVLDRMQDSSAGTRLRGVFDASGLVENDPEVTQALLMRASQDRVPSVRSAAIVALGPKLSSSAVGSELMSLLENAESPLVQLALVDLVLRNGSDSQLQQLSDLANENQLFPDLVQHVKKALQGEAI